MNYPLAAVSAGSRTLCFCAVFACLSAFGQTPAGAPPPTPAAAEQVLTLNPFEVQSNTDQSYGALNSNSITQFNTQLDRLPISADVFTNTFMQDTASTSVEDMIQAYSPGAGLTSADPASGAATSQRLDRNGNTGITLRGLSNTMQERDGLIPVTNNTGTGFTSTFDIERAEVINGPQGLLYGTGGGGGVINLVSKQARFGAPTTLVAQFQLDKYGDRMGQIDYGAGTEHFAVRAAIINQTVGGRRRDIGGPVDGYYVQFAARFFKTTTLRLNVEQTTYDRINSTNLTLAALSTSNDARNGDSLHYLLATNQIQAAANKGASGAGAIDNGLLNWGNVDSYGGWWSSELTVNEWAELVAESEWSSHLSTQFAVGWVNHVGDHVNSTPTFTAPNVAANTFPGQWAAGLTSTFPMNDTEEPGRTKAARFSALATNDFFDDRVHSETVIGADYDEGRGAQITYSYFQADSNFNVIVNPASTANQGRTATPKLYWPIAQGPLAYPLTAPRANRITIAGVNYVRMIVNQPSAALASANDPLGVTLGGQGFLHSQGLESGLYCVNYSQFMEGKLDTLAGFRLGRAYERTQNQGAAGPLLTNATQVSRPEFVNFDFGADYALAGGLRPYFSVSDSYNPPSTEIQDPYGRDPKTAHALGGETGLKYQHEGGKVSGTLAFYHIRSQNEQYQISGTLVNDINPTGLNGRLGSPSNWINIDRESTGLQATVTALPTSNWRLRLAGALVNGKVGTSTSYAQLYNDQFHENSSGQVTYADGNVVYVPATFNSKTLTVASTASGAIPLTVVAMSTPGNAYYASPQAVTGQILSTSNVAKVLAGGTDPAKAGSGILTGVAGLPISQLQINPGPSGVSLPGTIVTSRAGDATTGYPEIGASLTSVYTVASGLLQGVQAGGTLTGAWYNRSYYYYPNGFGVNADRRLFQFPTTFQFDLIAGYKRNLRRVNFRTQLNVTNVFNNYHIILLPGGTTGWSTPQGINATFTQQPRSLTWTNTLSF